MMQNGDINTDQSVQSGLRSSMELSNCNDSPQRAEVALTGNDVILPAEPELKQEETREKVGEAEEEADDGVPRDHGWAWMITLGVFVNYVLQSGYLKSSGLFFVELLEKFRAPASQTALLFSVRYGVSSVSGFYLLNVCLDRFGARKLTFIGGLLMALGAILSSLANQLTLLICVHSGLLAVGISILIYPGQVLMGHYFKRRRYLALCMTEWGVSIGNILIPPLVSYLLENYALQGTLLLYGGLCFNCLPAALLLRPLSYYSKRCTLCKRSPQPHDDVCVELEKMSSSCCDRKPQGVIVADKEPDMTLKSTLQNGHACLNSAVDVTSQEEKIAQCDDLAQESKNAESISFLVTRAQLESEAYKDTSLEQINVTNTYTKHSYSQPIQHRCRRLLKDVLNCPRALVLPLDFSLFRDPVFCLFMVYVAFCNFVSIPLDYLPALVGEHDVTESQAALLLSIIGGLDLVCRVTCGLIAHSNRVRISTLSVVSYVILGMALQFVPLMKSFEHYVVLAVFLGLLGSVANCLFSLLVIEFVGLDNMGRGLGWSVLVGGAVMFGLHPMLGYIRDITGSYVMVYHVIGGGMLVAALLLCCEGPVRRFKARRQKLIE